MLNIGGIQARSFYRRIGTFPLELKGSLIGGESELISCFCGI